MGDFSEIFYYVWKEFQRILRIIGQLSKNTSFLISIAEENSEFKETHQFLLNQSKETIWKSINNEKRLKKCYYKLSHSIQPFDQIFAKVQSKFPKTIDWCNSIYTIFNEQIESEVPLFLKNMKETGNNHKIQVSKLIWKEDESAFHNALTNNKKQPKIFFSHDISSCFCKEASIKPCFLQNKYTCHKTLGHLTEVFEFTSLFFSNLNSLCRNLLYIKLALEKFGKLLQNLKNMLASKLEYYKTLNESLKKSLSNERLYRVILKLIKIENILTEESSKLSSFIKFIPQQFILSKLTCVPISALSVTFANRPISDVLGQIDFEVNIVIKFIKKIMTPKKNLSSAFPRNYENYSSSFVFQIFHIRSILLKKLQPNSISVHLQKSITTLLGYIQDCPKLEKKVRGFNKLPVTIVRDWKLRSHSMPRNQNHSYNSSWDINTEENSMCVLEADEDLSESKSDSLHLQTYSPKNLSKTPELPYIYKPRKTALLTPEITNGFSERSSSRIQSFKSSTTQLTRTLTMATSVSDNKKKKEKDEKDNQKIRHGTNAFLNHRIQRIQNNKSISPLTKIEYIREEFANQLKPLEIKLKSSFLKLKGKTTFIFSMR